MFATDGTKYIFQSYL